MQFVTVMFIISCVLLIVLVLFQQSSSGLGALGGASDALLGPSKGDFFTKATSFFAVLFFVGALMLSILSSGEKSVFDEDLSATPTTPEQTAPAIGQPAEAFNPASVITTQTNN